MAESSATSTLGSRNLSSHTAGGNASSAFSARLGSGTEGGAAGALPGATTRLPPPKNLRMLLMAPGRGRGRRNFGSDYAFQSIPAADYGFFSPLESRSELALELADAQYGDAFKTNEFYAWGSWGTRFFFIFVRKARVSMFFLHPQKIQS